MLTQDEKLKIFLDAIDDYADKQRRKILTELETSNQDAIKRAEKETLSNAYEVINQRTADVKMQISRDIAKRGVDAKRALIEKRMDIEKKVFAKAEKKLLEFAKSDAYREHLLKTAKEAAINLPDNVSVRLRPADMKFEADVLACFGENCTVSADESIRLGGLYAESKLLGKAIDATFDTLLNNQHDRFEEKSGLSVQ